MKNKIKKLINDKKLIKNNPENSGPLGLLRADAKGAGLQGGHPRAGLISSSHTGLTELHVD